MSKFRDYHTDDYGRIHFDTAMARELLYEGCGVDDFCVLDDAAARAFNELCRVWDKEDHKLAILPEVGHAAQDEHRRRQEQWLFPQEITAIDVRDYVLGMCDSDIERVRVDLEMDLFEQGGMLPVLHLMIFLAHHFRENNIIYGVGRGSSVASFVLYKIGIHRIDSIKYGLDIRDFLK